MATTIKIPQVLNAGLAASVYICAAQAIGPMAVAHDFAFRDIDLAAVWCAVTIFLWTTKNFVDDYKAFDGSSDQAFNLAFTVFFSAVSYTTLACAASALTSGRAANDLLTAYFFILALWSACSYIRRRGIASPTPEESDRRRRRVRWIIMYLIVVGLSYVVAHCSSSCWRILCALMIWAIYIVDAYDCRTFSSTHTVPS